MYIGTTVDEWRTCNYATWNGATIEGTIPAGGQACLWNYFFDLAMPTDAAMFRLNSATGETVLSQRVDLTAVRDVFVIGRRNVVALAGGELPVPWELKPAGKKGADVNSVFCPVDDPTAPPLVLKPNLKGWYRIYTGIEPFLPHQFYLSAEQIIYPVPDYQRCPDKRGRNRFLREYYLKSADMTGQDVCLMLGGTVPHLARCIHQTHTVRADDPGRRWLTSVRSASWPQRRAGDSLATSSSARLATTTKAGWT